jgi:hypothetical protein
MEARLYLSPPPILFIGLNATLFGLIFINIGMNKQMNDVLEIKNNNLLTVECVSLSKNI